MATVQDFLSLTDDLICVLDHRGCVEEVNGNWKRFLDLPPDNNISLISLIEEADGEENFKRFMEDKSLPLLKISSCRLKDLSGKSFCIDLKLRRISAQNKYWCLIRDVSQDNHQQIILEQVSDSCHLGHWEYSSSNDTLTWSKKIFEIFNTHEFTTRPSINLFRSYFAADDFSQIENLKTNNFEFTFKITLDGQTKWIYLKGSRKGFSNGDYLLRGILRDVTLEVWKENAQLSNNIELSSFEKGLDQFSIVARTDARGIIIQANEEFCRISKYTEEELIGKDHRLLNSGFHSKSFFEDMWNCIKNGTNWRGEIKNKAKDGSYYWVDTIIIPLKDSDGNLLEILSFRFEITKFKEMQERNHILQNQLELLLHSQNHAYFSYGLIKDQLTLSPLMKDLMGDAKCANFNDFVSLFTKRDQETLLQTLADPKVMEFKDNILMNGKEISLQVKLLRNHLGEVIHLDGLCYLVPKRQSMTSPVNFLVKDFS